MRYCYECGRVTWGEPLFCNHCGRSYDVKLCPRLHANSRIAKVCRKCGSRELSNPQPKVPFLWKAFAYLVRMLLGGLLLWLSLFAAISVIEELLKRPQVQAGMICLGLLLLGLWFLWAMLPDWLRKFIRHRLKRKERKHDR